MIIIAIEKSKYIDYIWIYHLTFSFTTFVPYIQNIDSLFTLSYIHIAKLYEA